MTKIDEILIFLGAPSAGYGIAPEDCSNTKFNDTKAIGDQFAIICSIQQETTKYILSLLVNLSQEELFSVVDNKSLLDYAMLNGHQEVGKELYRLGVRKILNEEQLLQLNKASQENNIFCICNFIDEKYYLDQALDSQGNTLLIQAIKNACMDIVEILLDHGASPHIGNEAGETPIKLFEDKFPRSRYADSWLIATSRMNKPKLSQLLIQAGVNIDAKDNSGCTALLYQSHHNQTAIVKILLEKGAKICMNGYRRGPLQVAQGKTAELLIEYGADIYEDGAFLYHTVSGARSAFQKRDAQIGNYYQAIKKNQFEEVKAALDADPSLISCKCNPYTSCRPLFETAVEWALHMGHTKIAALLVSRGAEIKYAPKYFLERRDQGDCNILDHSIMLGTTDKVIEYCVKNCPLTLKCKLSERDDATISLCVNRIKAEFNSKDVRQRFPAVIERIADPVLKECLCQKLPQIMERYEQLANPATGLFKSGVSYLYDCCYPEVRAKEFFCQALRENVKPIQQNMNELRIDQCYLTALSNENSTNKIGFAERIIEQRNQAYMVSR